MVPLMGGLADWPETGCCVRRRAGKTRPLESPAAVRQDRSGAAMEAPPVKRARTEQPVFALLKEMAKEELGAAEANLRRLRTDNVALQEATRRAIEDTVEVMEKLAANRANLNTAQEEVNRLRMASAPADREAPRMAFPDSPEEVGLCPEHVFCGPNCTMRRGSSAGSAFPVSARGSGAAVGPFASGGLEPMGMPPAAVHRE